MSEHTNLFVKEKPAKAVISLNSLELSRSERMHVSEVSREIDTTFAHTVKIVSKLEEKGLVRSELKGRKKLLELTEQGREYANTLEQLMGEPA